MTDNQGDSPRGWKEGDQIVEEGAGILKEFNQELRQKAQQHGVDLE